MKAAKKLITMLLLAAMLVSAAACGGAPATDDTTGGDTTPSADTTLSEEEARLAIDDGLPEKDYEGYTFTIWSLSPDNYYIEAEDGDVVNDAKWKRQRNVEDRFNVKIAVNDGAALGGDWNVLQGMIQQSIMAQDNAFDIAMPHQIGGCPALITQHLVADWNDVPYINLEQPWWNQRINETIEIMDHQFFIAGQISLPTPKAMLFNKQYVEDYSLENPYDLVNNGTWTIDVLLEWTKLTSKDLNGDTEMDPEVDQYGISFNHDNSTLNFMYAFDHMSVIVGDDGEIIPNVNNEKMIAMVEKVIKLRWEDDRCLRTDYSNQGTLGTGGFKDGRIFIKCDTVGGAVGMRDSDIDFGLIPYPKWDEEQDGYYTHVDAWNGALCLPIGAPDYERTGIITEALCAETYKHVMPAYYDTALGQKYMRDEESIAMMDLIYQGIVYDFGYIFDQWKGTTWTLVRCVANQSTDVASYWAGIESTVKTHYDELFKAIENYDDY